MINPKENRKENKKLCEEHPDAFMICPRCNGTKVIDLVGSRFFLKRCDYCNGQGVITWIDKVARNMKNPFLEGDK